MFQRPSAAPIRRIARALTAKRWSAALMASGVLLLGATTLLFARNDTAGLLTWLRGSAMAPGDTVVVFGPSTFTTPSGSAQNFVETFNATVEQAREYTVRLVNGDSTNGTLKATGGYVRFNGVEIMSAAELAAGQTLVKSVLLFPSNTMETRISGGAGARVTVSVRGIADPTFAVLTERMFERQNGQPRPDTVLFTLPAAAGTPFTVFIRNGELDGTRRNSSSEAWINGVQVVQQADLNQSVSWMSRTVSLSSTPPNRLVVRMVGTPGSRLYFRITAADITPPVITINEPIQNQLTRDPTVQVSGSVRDETALTITVNGAAATVSPGAPGTVNFSATAALPNEGNNTVLVRAVNAAGLTTDSTRTVIKDTQAPTVTVTAPVDNLITNADSVTVIGSVSDQTTTTANLNGIPLTLGTGGSFSKRVALAEGRNFLTVTATDTLGNSASDVRVVIADRVAPTLVVTEPTDSTVTNAATVTVRGSVFDSTAVTVTVNGTNVAVAQNGSFTHDVTLADGLNTVSVIARDAATNQTTIARRVYRDVTPPVLTLTAPANGLITNADSVDVSGVATDAFGVAVTVNGVFVTVAPNGGFGTRVGLLPGPNLITVIATDGATNATSATRTVTQDKLAPTITITAPANGTTTNDASVAVTGTIVDSTAVTATINGQALTLGGNGAFSTTVNLVAGSNTITIAATDAANNSATATRTVTRGQPVPIDGPLPVDASVNAPQLDLSTPTTMVAATSFLYSGSNPIQTGVTAGTIVGEQAAVVRGRVLTPAGTPLAGVTVKIAGHPEFGTTLTRANGLYDLAVNGGGPLRVQMSKTGHPSAERKVFVPWQQHVVVDDVLLMTLDGQSTVVNFTQPVEVAQANVVTDTRGTRRAVLMFEQGTAASLVMPNGSTQPASSLTIRATEYTVGANGPNAMPAELPATSAYTYAVELSADEAIAAGATEVRFTKAVALYVDNFIGFKTGLAVPAGYFDRNAGVWIPADDGRVIQIVGVTAGMADVAVDSTLTPANTATLTALGFTDAERQQLAQRYAVGKTLWRLETTHFTPFDLNWFVRAFNPDDSPKPVDDNPKGPSCEAAGSIIGCEGQTLGEVIDLAGSGGYGLHYLSARTPGYTARQRLSLRLLRDTVPANLEEVVIEATAYGRNLVWHLQRSDLTPRYVFRIDLSTLLQGLDAYGRSVPSGTYLVNGTVRYVYRGDYGANGPTITQRTFARSGIQTLTAAVCDTTLPGCRPRLDATYTFSRSIQTWDARATHALGGWSLTTHHALDPVGGELLMGDGTRRTVADMGLVARTVAGTGNGACSGDGGPATAAAIAEAHSIAINASGSLFIGGYSCNRVRRVSTAGIISAFGPVLPRPDNLTIGPDGTLYVSTEDHRVLRMNALTGDTALFAGGGFDFTTDGIPAKGQARFFLIGGMAAALDGSVYIYNGQTRAVRRVMQDGLIYTVAGNGQSCGLNPAGGDGQPAIQVKLCNVAGIAVAPSGELYILDREWARTILRKVGLDGVITTVVASVTACNSDAAACGDNGPAALAGLSPNTNSVSVTRDGSILLTNHDRARRIGTDGIIAGVFGAGSGAFSYSGDNFPPLQTVFNRLIDAEIGPDGMMYVLDQLAYRVVRGVLPVPVVATQNIRVASEDAEEVYVFSPSGRHLQTIDVFTRHVLYDFGYDAVGRLIRVTDADGNITTVQRDGSGKPTAVVGPFGQRNSLTLDANGYLATVTNPANELTRVQHAASGLLATLIDPKGNPPHQFTYGESGRLTRDDNPAGGFKALARQDTDSTFAVTVATAMGRSTSYAMQYLGDGTARRTMTDPAGQVTRMAEGADRTSIVRTPEGDSVRVTSGADPRFGMQAPIATAFSVKLPSGLQASGRVSRIATLSNPNDPLSLVTETDSLILNGRIATATYDATLRRRTYTSAQGRQSVSLLDATGRIVERRDGTDAPTRFTYGSRGLLTTIVQAGRTWRYDYDSAGRVKKTTDPLGRIEQYAFDSAGRITKQTLPNAREILYTYDANGNLTSITPPSRPAHTLAYTPADKTQAYTPPSAGLPTPATTYTYNLDRQLSVVTRPDGLMIGLGYDLFGRNNALTLPTGTLGISYGATGLVSTVTSTQGGTLGFTYDGSVLKTATWSGTVQGSVGHTYDTNLRVSAVTVNGANSISFGYDQDNLLTSAGAMTLARDAATGRLIGTTLGSATTTHSYDDSVGTLKTSLAKHGTTTLYDATYARDSLDRVVSLVESVQGASRTLAYAYDSVGRLDQVRLGGTLVADYDYDANGNRTQLTTQSGSVTATTDDQDRLLTYASASYAYTPNGELQRKVVGPDTTRYTYDVLGNLLQVRQPAGQVIDYVVDGLNRRIGKKVNGALAQGFLYETQLAPAAELNGSNQVVSRYIYGAREKGESQI